MTLEDIIWRATRFAVTRTECSERNADVALRFINDKDILCHDITVQRRSGGTAPYILINDKDILCHDIKVQRRSGGTAPYILILDTG